MATITTVIYNVVARDNASRTLYRVGESAAATESRVSRMGAALIRGGALAATAFVAAGVEAAKMATQFQASMTRVQTQAGASAKDVRVLSDAVLRLAPSTQQGPQQLADALYHLKSLGMDNARAMKALAQASNLAAVGGASLEETTSAIGAAWRSGVHGAKSFGQAAGTVNAIIGAGNMRMSDFIDALSSGILPAARTFGVSLKSVGAALALMTDEGIPAQLAATRLRMTLSLLGAPSNTAAAELKSIGISATGLANAMRHGGIVQAVGMLASHIKSSGLNATQAAQLISRAFGGGRSSAAIMTLLNNLEVLRRKQQQINDTTGRWGSDVAAQRRTVQAQLAILRSSFETFAIRAGRAILPPLNDVLTWINKSGIPAIGRFWAAVSGVFGGGPRTHRAPTPAQRLPAAPGPRLRGRRDPLFAGGGGPAPRALRLGQRATLDMTLRPGTAAAAAQGIIGQITTALRSGHGLGSAIGDVIGRGFQWLTSHLGMITGKLIDALGKIDWVKVGGVVGSNAAGFAIGLVSHLGNDLFSVSFWQKHWLDFVEAALSVLMIGRLGGVIAKILDHIPILRWFAPLFRGLQKITDPIWRAMGNVARAIGRGLLRGVERELPGAFTGVGRFFADLIGRVVLWGIRIRGAAERFARGIGPGLLRGAEGLGNIVGRVVGRLIRWVAAPFGEAASLITRAWRAAARLLSPLWDGLGRVFARVAGGMSAEWRGAVGFVRAAWHRAGAFLAGGFAAVVTAWQSMTGGLHDAWSNTLGSIRKIARLAWDYIKLAALQMVDAILKAFSHIPFIGHFFKTAEGNVAKWMRQIQADIDRLNGRNVNLGVHLKPVGTGPFSGKPLATGGKITGPGGPTADKAGLFALSNREWVIRANSATRYGDAAMRAVNEGKAVIGYAHGGPVKGMAGGGPVELTERTRLRPGMSRFEHMMDVLLERGARKFARSLSGSGESIVRYAMQYLHKVPYVWGGTTPAGWDCSGMTGWDYRHNGYPGIPRTSQQQQVWAQPSRNMPGALVFFYGRHGAASHVGISLGNGHYIGADDPALGTTIQSTAGNTGFGIPPGGFHARSAGGMLRGIPGVRGGGGTPVELGRALAAQLYGWRGRQWADLHELWNRESGWNPRARNPLSGAAGIPQDITGNFHGGARGQILWGLRYIRGRYRSPARAWAHERADNWYASGTAGAKPGWGVVGENGLELVRFRGGEQVLDHASSLAALMSGASGGAVPGYAAGTSRSSRLSAVDRFAFGSETTTKAIRAAMEDVRRLIRRLYSGHQERWRLEDSRKAWHHLDDMARDLHGLRHTIASARAYRATVASGLRDYGQLSNVGLDFTATEGGPATSSLAGGFAGQLQGIRRFGHAIHRLRRAGLSRPLLRQIADMGPDQGLQYAQAILSAPHQIRGLNRTQRQITAATRGVSTQVAGDVYGLGAGFVHGLRHERRAIDAEMTRMAHTFARELAAWFHVPAPHRHRRRHSRAAGGPITEHVLGVGLATGEEWMFHAGEHVTPHTPTGGRDAAGLLAEQNDLLRKVLAQDRGPLVHVERQEFRTETDVPKIAQQLSFRITAAGLGG